MKPGRIVTFSGLDGCGKTTQIEALVAALEAQGQTPYRVWSRGGYTEGVLLLKRALRRALGRRAPPPGPSQAREKTLGDPRVAQVWLTVAMLDLVRLYGLELPVRKALGQTVVCDRYLWDTLADFKVNFPDQPVEQGLLWRLLAAVSARPDGAFFLALDPTEAERRALEKQDPFPEPTEARRRRAAIYEDLLARGLFTRLDATAAREAIAARIRGELGLGPGSPVTPKAQPT